MIFEMIRYNSRAYAETVSRSSGNSIFSIPEPEISISVIGDWIFDDKAKIFFFSRR